MKKLLILLLPITIFSQENYYDTTIARLINQKINEYRISKNRYNLIKTDRLKSETEEYCINAAQKLNDTGILSHSSITGNGKYSEVICYVPFNWSEINADSLASSVVNAYIKSKPHNVAILGTGVTKIHTSVYVYYDPKQKDWQLFTASQIIDYDFEIALKYDPIELEY